MYRIFCLVFAMALAVGSPHPAFSGPDRPVEDGRLPRLEDFLALEEFGLVRPSPDGRLLAVEIRRPRAGERFTASMDLFARSDLWIVDAESREVVRITDGSADGSWYWSPVWSPDSRRLALLAGGPDGHVRLGLWERGRHSVQLLTERSVDVKANFGALSPYPPHGHRAAVWLDGHRLLTVLLPHSSFNREVAVTNARHVRGSQWKRTERGMQAATIWDSRNVAVCHNESSLMLIDVEEHSAIRLLSGAVRAVSVSPDRRFAAVIRAARSRGLRPEMPAEFPLAWNAYTLDARISTDLAVIDLAGSAKALESTKITGLNTLSRRRFPRWSRDSRHLAVPARSLDGEDRTFLASLDGSDVRSFDVRSLLDAELFAELLTMADNPRQAASALRNRPRFHEVDFSPEGIGGEVVRLTSARVAVLSQGQVYVLGRDGLPLYTFSAPEGELVHPLSGNRHPSSSLLFDSGPALTRVEIGSAEARFREIPKPRPSSHLVAKIGENGPYVLAADDDDGSFLWLSDLNGAAGEPVIRINTDLAHLIAPQRLMISYRLPSDERRTGLILLPPSYEDKRRYPAALYVYPRVLITEDWFSRSFLNRYSFHRLTLLAAAGYVVLFPSIPVPRGEEPLEILSLVTDNVLPAAEALVDRGYADGSRLGVYGHSYGGYTTLAVVTQSNRFRAAVASASFPDLISYHDSVRPEAEILPCGLNIARSMAMELEARGGILRMRAPPLAALERYVRNSPYFHLSRVRTPVLFLHGELDAVPAEAVERAVVALDRLGVPVRFVRYWGEAHNLRSSRNIRHAWSETLRWFDSFLRDKPPER